MKEEKKKKKEKSEYIRAPRYICLPTVPDGHGCSLCGTCQGCHHLGRFCHHYHTTFAHTSYILHFVALARYAKPAEQHMDTACTSLWHVVRLHLLHCAAGRAHLPHIITSPAGHDTPHIPDPTSHAP